MSNEGIKWIHAEYILPPEYLKIWNERLKRAREALELAETEEQGKQVPQDGGEVEKELNSTSSSHSASTPCEDDPASA